MRRVLLQIQLIVFYVLLATTALWAQTVTVGTTEWPPYFYHEGTQQKGLFVDLFTEIKKRSGIDFQVVEMPQNRVLQYFRDKKIDIESFVNPEWRVDDKDISVYTVPMMASVNIILMLKNRVFTARSSNDFTGKNIGCILGYFYPEGFSDGFKASKIIRSDALSHESLVQMLKLGRVDAIILDRLVAHYTIKKLGFDPDEFDIAYRFAGNSHLALRVNRDKASLLPKLNEAIKKMVGDHFANKVILTYLYSK